MRQDRNFARTSLHLDHRQLDRLREISQQTGVPVAFMVRRSIDSYLDQRGLDPSSHGRLEPLLEESR